jgi:hypothetical protein
MLPPPNKVTSAHPRPIWNMATAVLPQYTARKNLATATCPHPHQFGAPRSPLRPTTLQYQHHEIHYCILGVGVGGAPLASLIFFREYILEGVLII